MDKIGKYDNDKHVVTCLTSLLKWLWHQAMWNIKPMAILRFSTLLTLAWYPILAAMIHGKDLNVEHTAPRSMIQYLTGHQYVLVMYILVLTPLSAISVHVVHVAFVDKMLNNSYAFGVYSNWSPHYILFFYQKLIEIFRSIMASSYYQRFRNCTTFLFQFIYCIM